MTETSTQAAPAPLQVRVTEEALPHPISFFGSNVDNWGAAEWFDRLAKAVRAQDAAVLAGDAMWGTYKMIAASSALTLVREHEATVRAALDLSTPTQIAALEAENVKLRAERALRFQERDTAIRDAVYQRECKERAQDEVARLTEALKAEQATRGKHLAIKDDGDEIMIANGRVFVSVDADEMSYALLRDGEWKPGQHSLSSSPFEAWREITLAVLKGSTDDAQA